MALFVLIVVAVVVGSTWLDWREAVRARGVPEWAKGMALGGLIAVSLAATTSFASVWLQEAASQWTAGVVSWRFAIECGALVALMGAIVFAARRKRARLLLFIACLVAAAFCLGVLL